MGEISAAEGFDWDPANTPSRDVPGIALAEIEQVFFNAPLLSAPRLSASLLTVARDSRSARSGPTSRWHALGRTDGGRLLHVTLTLREAKTIRIISARDFHRHEELHMSHENLKAIPEFADEGEERAFWETQDSSEYLNWSRARQTALPNLKASTKSISLRLPLHLLDSIKNAANARDVPYQSLIKIWLQEKVAQRR